MDTAEDQAWGSELVRSNTSTSPEEERAARYLETQGYSSFLYWREPLVDLVDVDLDEQEEMLEVVRSGLSQLDVESSTDEKTETEEVLVEEEEMEKEDLPEKKSEEDDVDNARSLEETALAESVNNTEDTDDNKNTTTATTDEVDQEESSEEKG